MKTKKILPQLFRQLLPTIGLVAILSTPVCAQEVEKGKVWIEIESKVSQALRQQSKLEPVIRILETTTNGQNIVALVNESELPKLSHFVHQQFKRCGGYVVLGERLDAVHVLKRFQRKVKKSSSNSSLFADYQINKQTEVTLWASEISEVNMEEVIIHLSSYKTRYYKAPEGVAAMKWLGEKWRSLTSTRSDVTLEYYSHANYPQPSVILTFLGENQTSTDLGPIIVLGGHGDSINTDDEGIHSHAPGADDNAAGMALLTEVIRLMVEHNYAPKHTIQFISYAAEEVGIQGSYELARVYRQKKREILGAMQFDGVNYKGPSYDMSLVGDNTNPEQNKFVAGLIDTYLKAKWRYEYCGYACSDHAAWNYEGYPVSYPVEGIASEQNPYFHTKEDTFDKSQNSAAHAAMFTKLALAFLLELDR